MCSWNVLLTCGVIFAGWVIATLVGGPVAWAVNGLLAVVGYAFLNVSRCLLRCLGQLDAS